MRQSLAMSTSMAMSTSIPARQAFFLGCGQALAWLLLILVEQLVEKWAGVIHYESDAGLKGLWNGFTLCGSALILVLGVTLWGRWSCLRIRSLCFLLLGWIAAAVVIVPPALYFMVSGIVVAGAG